MTEGEMGYSAALPPPDRWRPRWFVNERWGALHRIASIRWEDDENIGGRGVTVCELRGDLTMPGIFSRMGPRCARDAASASAFGKEKVRCSTA